jgi:hypothetical protein
MATDVAASKRDGQWRAVTSASLPFPLFAQGIENNQMTTGQLKGYYLQPGLVVFERM